MRVLSKFLSWNTRIHLTTRMLNLAPDGGPRLLAVCEPQSMACSIGYLYDFGVGTARGLRSLCLVSNLPKNQILSMLQGLAIVATSRNLCKDENIESDIERPS